MAKRLRCPEGCKPDYFIKATVRRTRVDKSGRAQGKCWKHYKPSENEVVFVCPVCDDIVEKGNP